MTDGILGHGPLLERLRSTADRGSLHHAYLFEGPRGLGKRRVADWLATYVNCKATEGPRPCGSCSRCVQINAGTHPDVIVVEPPPKRASGTIAIADIREVIRKAGYHRFDAARRFILIDPADAMLEPAANALLKTLEEPPEGTGFILIATSSSSLLPTIVSRCQQVRFGAVDTGAIADWLRTRSAEDADLAARFSLGCPGKALELSQGGMAKRLEARSTLARLATSPLKATLDHNDQLTKKRSRSDWMRELQLLVDVLEELLRDVAIQATGASVPLLHEDAPAMLDAWTRRLWPVGVSNLHRAIEEARDQLEVNVSGRLVLDGLLTRMRVELGPPR